MMERLQQLFGTLGPLMMDASTSLETKVERIVGHYIDLLLETPDLPIFVLSEIRNDASLFSTKIPLVQMVEKSSLVQQLREKRPDIHPFHFLMNILGMTVFPFIASPVFASVPLVQQKGLQKMMEERKTLIPQWVKAMLEQV